MVIFNINHRSTMLIGKFGHVLFNFVQKIDFKTVYCQFNITIVTVKNRQEETITLQGIR